MATCRISSDKGILHAAFFRRRRRLFPADDRRLPDLAVRGCGAFAVPRRACAPRVRCVDAERTEPAAGALVDRGVGALAGDRVLVEGETIEPEELLGPRRKAFAKLDKNANGALSFDEWAHTTIDKFAGADKDRNRILTPAEYATTAPPPLFSNSGIAARAQ